MHQCRSCARPIGAGRWLVPGALLLALACTRSRLEAGADSGPGGSAGAVSSSSEDEQRSGQDAGTSACPAPGRDPMWTCNPALSYWARDPVTRTCCFYAALCEVPRGWAAFETEEQCRTDCRCQEIEPFSEEPFSLGIARQSLECGCAGSDWCETTFEQDRARECAGSRSVLLARGCGRLELSNGPALTGGSTVYDEASGRVIGGSSFSDILHRPCLTSVSISGADFDCPSATRCVLCGDGPPDMPRCE